MAIIVSALFLCVVVGAALAVWRERQRLANKRARFAGRLTLLPEEIHKRTYLGSHIELDQFLMVWGDIASLLKLDPTKLRPEDRFDDVLGPVSGFMAEDETADVDDYIISQCRANGLELPSRKVMSLDDCVQLLCRASR